LSLMSSSSSLNFFPATALDTYNGPPCLHCSACLGTVAVTHCH
jgi:hypothetical protein